jgi:hypothetical protein
MAITPFKLSGIPSKLASTGKRVAQSATTTAMMIEIVFFIVHVPLSIEMRIARQGISALASIGPIASFEDSRW